MIAPAACEHANYKKSGKNRNGTQRYKCKDCGVRFSDEKPLGRMQISMDSASLALSLLLEGMSIRAASRISGIHRDTIGDLILVAGEKFQAFTDRSIVNVTVNDVQIDELWSFVGCKSKTAEARGYDDLGDSWTFIAIERDTKLIIAHHVGNRNTAHTDQFLAKVRRAVNDDNRYQVTTDGMGSYRYSVPFGLGSNIDFAQLIKKYAASQTETRYSPATIVSADKVPRFGNPDESRVCTSHVERANLTVRMQLRRFTRLTNGFSKCHDHHEAMQSIFFAHYNFCRTHMTLKSTPAMASGLASRPLTIREILEAA